MPPVSYAPLCQALLWFSIIICLARFPCSCLPWNLKFLMSPRKGTDFQIFQLFSYCTNRTDDFQVLSMLELVSEVSNEILKQIFVMAYTIHIFPILFKTISWLLTIFWGRDKNYQRFCMNRSNYTISSCITQQYGHMDVSHSHHMSMTQGFWKCWLLIFLEYSLVLSLFLSHTQLIVLLYCFQS